nr:copia protein [Tanacetum cinerariifolium]
MKVSKRKEKVVVSSDSEESDADDFSELKKITALLAKSFNRRKFYSKPTNNKLRTSFASQSANKKQDCKKEGHFAKDCKKVKVNDYEYYKTKMLLVKKDKYEQVLLVEDHAWMESSSDLDQEINANMVFMAQIKKVLSDSEASSSFADDKISDVSYYLSESESESEYETSEYYNNTTPYGLFVNDNDDQEIFHDCENFPKNLIESQIDHNESAVDHNDSEGIDKLIRKYNKKISKCLKPTTFEMKNNELNDQMKVLIEKNDDLLSQTNVLKDQLQVKHVVIDTHVECQKKYAKLEAERYKYMIRYSAYFDNDKQHRKQIANQEVLYDKMSVQLVEMDKHVRDLKNTVLEKDFKISKLEECVRNKDLEIEKYLERLNDCEDKLHKMGQTNQTVHMIMPYKDKIYNGRKGIGFENPSYFSKAKNLRPTIYDERVINLGYTLMFLTHSDEALEIEKFKEQEKIKLKKIIIDLEDEVVSLLEKEKANLETIESLISKECDKVENSKVIAPGMFKLSVSQSVSLISVTKTSCALNSVENLDTLSSVRRPKPSGVMRMKKGSSNTVKADLSSDNHSNLNKNVKLYSRKNLMACNNSDTRSVFDCNNARNALCNARMNVFVDVNDLFVFVDIIQICLWIIDSGCSKHMTGNRALLTNFVEKFLGTVRFGNNDFAMIAGYGDVVIRSMTIKKVYYVEGLGHNLFSVGQFYDKGLEVAFRKSTCFVRTEDGVDFLAGDRSSNLYNIALNEVASNSSACLLVKASSSQSWLWHQRLSHLDFATINNLVKNNLVQGLPKMKFEKDHLCSACEQGKIHQKHHKSKTAFVSNKPLYLLHMDLCAPMRVESINEKRYVLVVVDDYSRYTCIFFLHSKDEASENLQQQTRKIHESVRNKMHKAFPLLVRKFQLPEGTSHCLKKNATARRKVLPLPEVCTAIIVKEKPSVKDDTPENSPSTTTTSTTSGDKSGRTVTLTTENMQNKKNDVKARTTLLLSLPDEHQLRFSKHKTAKELWAAILKTFGGNEATKKTKKNLLKQQYGNFRAEGAEMLERTFTRLITSTLKFRNVLNDANKLMRFPYSLEGPLKLGGNLLSKTPQDALTIIKNKSKVCYSQKKPVVSKVSTTSSGSSSSTDARIDKLTDTILNFVETFNKKMTTPATMKVVEETCVTFGGAHLYYD